MDRGFTATYLELMRRYFFERVNRFFAYKEFNVSSYSWQNSASSSISKLTIPDLDMH